MGIGVKQHHPHGTFDSCKFVAQALLALGIQLVTRGTFRIQHMTSMTIVGEEGSGCIDQGCALGKAFAADGKPDEAFGLIRGG